jgi:hypothetical protein
VLLRRSRYSEHQRAADQASKTCEIHQERSLRPGLCWSQNALPRAVVIPPRRRMPTMPLEPLLVDYSVGRVRPAMDPWVPNLVILFLLAFVLGIAAVLRLATTLVRVRLCRGVATLVVRAPRSTGRRMRSRPRPPRPVGSLPFVVLALLAL